jgi:hypothetical protein
MDAKQLLTIVEQYYRKIDTTFEDIKVTRVADRKTVFVRIRERACTSACNKKTA